MLRNVRATPKKFVYILASLCHPPTWFQLERSFTLACSSFLQKRRGVTFSRSVKVSEKRFSFKSKLITACYPKSICIKTHLIFKYVTVYSYVRSWKLFLNNGINDYLPRKLSGNKAVYIFSAFFHFLLIHILVIIYLIFIHS